MVPEWRDWIITNTSAEVPLTTLIEEMVKNNLI